MTTTQPVHTKLEGGNDLETAINSVISQAQRYLRIFDYNLSEGSYNSPDRFELLRNFLLLSRANRLDMMLHETDHLTRYCPRMIILLQQFSHAIRINKISPEAKGIDDPFIIADESHYVHRFHYNNPRALLGLNDNPGALKLSKRFTEIWDTSTPSTFATTLGL